MKANEARAITNASLRGPVIDHWVRALAKHIRVTAEKGKNSIDPWAYLATLRTPSPNRDEQDSIAQHFRKLDYKVTDHDNPDPGHPCSRNYTTLSW